jgi:puromycin-sensitive aminopeptidase
MKWWNGIWLNEAFATFMEVASVDAYRPAWERWVSFSTERAAAMLVDGLESTRPIEYEVVSPADADGMFDVLTYQKGGAVLRMLETYLGPERFRDGIRLYLRRHAYGNTETTDLWDAIEEATGEPVRSIMDSWILQGGHPVVSVSSADGQITLDQRRFRYLPDPSDAEARWQVPILLRTLDGDEHDRRLLTDASTTLPLQGSRPVVNAGGWGVFRTRYEPSVFASLVLRFTELDAIERFNVVSDTWAVALAGEANVDPFLELVSLLGEERNPSVWDAAIGGLDALHRINPSASYQSWVRDRVQPVFETVGWEPARHEDERVAKLRGQLVETLGTIGADPAVVARCQDLDRTDVSAVTPDLWGPIATVAAWNGDEDTYERFWTRVRKAATPQDEVRYLYRLPLFRQESLLDRTLEATLTEIRSQNGAFVITAGIANRAVGRRAWAWLTAHWDDVLKRLPANTHGRVIDGITRLWDPKSLSEVPAFLADHPIPTARKQVDQLLERQRINAAFAARQAGPLASRFG